MRSTKFAAASAKPRAVAIGLSLRWGLNFGSLDTTSTLKCWDSFVAVSCESTLIMLCYAKAYLFAGTPGPLEKEMFLVAECKVS